MSHTIKWGFFPTHPLPASPLCPDKSTRNPLVYGTPQRCHPGEGAFIFTLKKEVTPAATPDVLQDDFKEDPSQAGEQEILVSQAPAQNTGTNAMATHLPRGHERGPYRFSGF